MCTTASARISAQLEGITLVYEPGGTEGSNYQDQLRAEVAAGTAPDVFWIPGTDIADFAKRGLILNIADLAAQTEGFDVNAFYPGPMYHLTYNPETGQSGADSGALWGLPRDVSTFVLYLNLDLINEAGAPDPRELAAQGKCGMD
jgi:multiple sugar transport system substrate-binding protein